jgi:hypothetical protein
LQTAKCGQSAVACPQRCSAGMAVLSHCQQIGARFWPPPGLAFLPRAAPPPVVDGVPHVGAENVRCGERGCGRAGPPAGCRQRLPAWRREAAPCWWRRGRRFRQRRRGRASGAQDWRALVRAARMRSMCRRSSGPRTAGSTRCSSRRADVDRVGPISRPTRKRLTNWSSAAAAQCALSSCSRDEASSPPNLRGRGAPASWPGSYERARCCPHRLSSSRGRAARPPRGVGLHGLGRRRGLNGRVEREVGHPARVAVAILGAHEEEGLSLSTTMLVANNRRTAASFGALPLGSVHGAVVMRCARDLLPVSTRTVLRRTRRMLRPHWRGGCARSSH